jgi:hypothetical protein
MSVEADIEAIRESLSRLEENLALEPAPRQRIPTWFNVAFFGSGAAILISAGLWLHFHPYATDVEKFWLLEPMVLLALTLCAGMVISLWPDGRQK